MPYKEKQIAKIYWSIAEVAKLVHQATSAVRFWERSFYWIKVKKGKAGHRQYTKESINHIVTADFALNHIGMTCDGVIKAYTMGYLDSLVGHIEEIQKDYKDV